ncbi:MAG TPA: DotA/TraY family protein [Gammaproteobacteria bacterium]|jgi:conjugal transfer/type IV secretion protein DotA/TraY|nr:DotA/TraY family protein [Gammaproteobacteria bacterium]
MINLFDISSNDRSIYYLNMIFGSMSGIIPGGGGNTATLLGTMFQTFNTVVLAVGAIIVIYVTIVSVLATAHEGEFMGKKWNNIWIPIRTVLGIAALVPVANGYSGLQLIMMWVIVQGIGAADTLWTSALSFINNAGSAYAQMPVPSAGSNQAFAGLFQALVCDATSRMNVPTPNDGGAGYFCYDKSQSGSAGTYCSGGGGYTPFPSGATAYSLGPNGACGTLKLCDPSSCGDASSLACMACQAQGPAVAAVVSVLGPIAVSLAQADYTYRQFVTESYSTPNNSDWSWVYTYCSKASPAIPQDECCVSGSTSTPNKTCKSGSTFFPANGDNTQNANNDAVTKLFWPYAPGLGALVGAEDILSLAGQSYTAAMNDVFTEYLSQQGQNDVGSELQDAQNDGWFFAGAYYYEIASMNGQNQAASMPQIDFTPNDPASEPSNTMASYRNNYQAASQLLGASQEAGGDTSSLSESVPQMSGMNSAVTSTLTDVNNGFTATVNPSSGTNPLIALHAWGYALLLAAEVLFLAVVAAAFIMFILGYFNIWVWGFGFFSPAGPAMMGLFFILIPALVALIGFLVAVGGLLGIYTPLIPYMIFTFGTIGWLTSTIETMVAGPLVALGILSPSNNHELLGAAGPGLMLLFNVFLRPSLMIFGLMAGMLMATVVVDMINSMFWNMVWNSGLNPNVNILAWILFLIAYVVLILGALNKAFALIYILPENVMRWIGGQGEKYGEEGALGEAKRGFDSASGAVGSTMQGGGEKMSDFMEKRRKKAEKAMKKQKKGASVKGTGGGGEEK